MTSSNGQRPVESLRAGGLSANWRRDAIAEQNEWVREHSDAEDQVSSKGFAPGMLHIPQPSALFRCGQPGELDGNIQKWLDGCGDEFVSAESLAEHRKHCTERKGND
jgi:hypothetical protein